VVIGALLMGRVGYVAANSAILHSTHRCVAALGVGGLNGVGAWIGGLVASYLWAPACPIVADGAALLAPAALLGGGRRVVGLR
jgi:hypothetical protein